MLYMDTIKILIVLFAWNGISLVVTTEDGNHDSKRMQPLPNKSDPYDGQDTVENPTKYPDRYDSNQDQIEISEKYIEPQRHSTRLQDEYHEEKTIEYMNEDREVPQAYKFGFEIKDKKEGEQFRQEQKDEHGNIQGRFGYRDAKGQYRHVEYVADDYGFRANVKTNEAGTANENPADVEMHAENNGGHQEHHPQNMNAMSHAGESNKVYKTEQTAGSDHHSQQSVAENEPQSEETRYGNPRSAVANDYSGYEPYHHHERTNNEPEPGHYSKNEKYSDVETVGYNPRSYRYFLNERMPHSGYEHSSIEREPEKKYKKESRTPQESHQGKSRIPDRSTYQYELGGDRYIYKYVKQPSQPEREIPEIDHAYEEHEQEYRIPKHEYTPQYAHTDPEHHLPDEYEGYGNTEDKKSLYHPSPEKEFILPQKVEPDYNMRAYHQEQHKDQENTNYGYPEKVRVLKYEYPDEPAKVDKSKVVKPVQKVVPVVHQYVQIINEHQRPALSDYDKNHRSTYGYRHVPQEKIVSHQHPIVYLESENQNKHKQEQELSYGKKHNMHTNIKREPYYPLKLDSLTGYHGNEENLSPKPKELQNSNGNSKSLQKAVLELNSEVYKKLIENKTPGTRFVAIPVNGHLSSPNSDKMTHSNSPQPHGILHIPLNGASPVSIDLKSLVLHIPHKISENSDSPTIKYQDYEPNVKKQLVYSHESSAPIAPAYKQRQHQNKDYSKTKWIPMTPSWNQIRRKSPQEVGIENSQDTQMQTPLGLNFQISSEDAFKFLQGESSTHAIELKRNPGKLINKDALTNIKQKTPRVYILSSSYRNISPIKDLNKQSAFSLPRL